jgi:hypothetical protein
VDKPEKPDTRFDVDHVTVPVVVPMIVPITLPTPIPVVFPFVMPRIVPLSLSVAAFAGGRAQPDTGETSVTVDVTPETEAAQPTLAAPAPEPAPAQTEVLNFPVKIVSINKVSEIVTLQNVSNEPVDLQGWRMVSVLGQQQHPGIEGVIAPGEQRHFANVGKKIWRDDASDDGALYAPDGQLVSYWNDPV